MKKKTSECLVCVCGDTAPGYATIAEQTAGAYCIALSDVKARGLDAIVAGLCRKHASDYRDCVAIDEEARPS